MKIAVFGSTGGNGRLILDEAMRRGHEVTAFARRGGALAGVAAWPLSSRGTAATGLTSRKLSRASGWSS